MMKFAKKLLVFCVMTAMICIPAYADDEVVIDTSLLMFGSANLTVYVDGEVSNSLSDTYTPYDVVTIEAPNVTGKTFTYWANNEGNIISYNRELTLNIYANTVLNAVYSTGTVTAQPAAEFLSITRTSSQIMFNVIATAPSDNSVTEYGIRYSTTKNTLDGLKGNDGVTAETAAISDTNFLFGVTASDNTTYYVTAYVISGGNTYYSDVKTVNMSDLDEGVTSVAALMDLLLGESFDAVSNEVQTAFQSSLCNVNFDANKGSRTMPVQGFMKNTATALNANIFTRSYYTFNGWNTKDDGTGTSYSDGAEVSLTESITLYAQWKPVSYTISYALDGGTNNSSNPTSYAIESPDITLQAPTKTGYTFANWTSGDVEVTKIATGTSGNITLTANWTLNTYTISYDLGGGTNNSSNPTSYAVESPDITLQTPTKTGYTFANWTSGDVKVTSIPKGSTGNRTLKANWTANTYTVKFNSNGGTGSMSDLTLTYDVEQALSNNTFTRTGYTFNGWKDNDGNKTYNGGASVKNLTAVKGATITLYAQWKVNQYTLTFNTDGGTTINAITQDYGTAVTAPANPTKEGYTFNGWDKEIPSTMPAENLTFTAQWKENEKTSESEDIKQEEPAEETPESTTADAEKVATMSDEELKQTFENKTEITLTGNISNENVAKVIEKITSVTEVKTLDLSKLENVTEVKLPETVKIETLTVSGNETIKKVEVQNNTSLKSINLSSSKVETIDAKGCTELTEVILTSCDELQKLDVSETPITKLDTSNCEKLSSINCNSCDITELNIDGCKKLADLHCANNSLARLDVSGFSLNSLECQHQRLRGLRRTIALNILDILLRRAEAFLTSEENENDLSDVANVKDIQAFDDNGGKIDVEFNDETGDVSFSKEPAIIQYNYITGFKDISMDVTAETGSGTQTLSGSGGGCSLSGSFLILSLLGGLIFKRKN